MITTLLVGDNDHDVLELSRAALGRLHEPKHLVTVPGAIHLFPESGALDAVVRTAIDWFDRHLGRDRD